MMLRQGHISQLYSYKNSVEGGRQHTSYYPKRKFLTISALDRTQLPDHRCQLATLSHIRDYNVDLIPELIERGLDPKIAQNGAT